MNHPLLDDVRRDVGIEAAYLDCARIARREARNFYYAFLPLRKERRYALYAVYSFARLADDLADQPGRDRAERLALLNTLEERLREAVRGEPRGAVFVALADGIRRFDIPEQTLHDLLSGVRRDQEVTRIADWEELQSYCYLVAGTVGLVCAAIFEARGEDAERCAVAQGLGMQLVNIMRDVGEDARNGRIYIPADLLSRHGVTEEDIMTGRTGEGWRALMSEIGERAHEALEEGGGILPLSEPDARICPALLRDLYLRILERIERADYEVFRHDMDLSLAGKLLILSRAWWRYRIRRR